MVTSSTSGAASSSGSVAKVRMPAAAGGQIEKTVGGGVAPGGDFEEVRIRGEFRDVHLAPGATEAADPDFDFRLHSNSFWLYKSIRHRG